MEYEDIDWTFDEETGIGTVVIDRPDSLNAMTEYTLAELADGFERFEAVDRDGDGVTVRAVVVEGAGEQAFSAGADVNEFGEVDYPYVDQQWQATMDAVASCPVPVVAKIDGHCVGGGLELALACDFRIASDRSEFGFPEIDLGLVPNGGGTARLATLVGPSRTKELCMTGEFVDASRAVEDGIVNQVYEAEDLDQKVRAFAETLASKAPLAVRVVKEIVDETNELGLRDGLAYEHRASLPLYYTEDYREGVDAFTEGREPEWQGR